MIPAGALEFVSVPEALSFGTSKLSTQSTYITREDPNWSVVISDTHTASNGWKLFANTSGPLRTPGGAELPDALQFVDAAGMPAALGTDMLLVDSGSAPQPGSEIQDVSWLEDKGILFRLNPGNILIGEAYSTTITWTLMDTP